MDASNGYLKCLVSQGKGGEALSTELAADLQRCLLGGKSGAGRESS